MKLIKKIYHFIIPMLADWFYGCPGKKMIVIGVTGTKGKSTTCRFVASALMAGGYRVGVLSTVEFQIGDRRVLNDKKMSMLGRGQIQKMMADMVKAGCQYAVIETSSEGILQYRHLGVHYDIAVFTNLGTEHNERHGGFDNLKRDKGKLFASLRGSRKKLFGSIIKKIVIANADDGQALFYLNYESDDKYSYSVSGSGIHGVKNFKAESVKPLSDGVEFILGGQNYRLNIPGDFNVYNAMAAITVALSQNIPPEKIAVGLASVKKLEGRMEFVEAGQNFKVIVDYAHEPISYTALFTTMRQLAGVNGRTLAIIGSDGGGRDIGKRRQMGQIAGEICDIVIVSDVNCFDEDPHAIAEMLAGGARTAGKRDGQNLFIEIDRGQAIELAVKMARAGDVVAITAKGTEPHIAVAKGQKIPWSDYDMARKALINIGEKK
ncbi:MAG: UDP-N-acetylmuramyl-tripeptide synthetase [Candidatus Magasanikbacteria bacterium]